MPSLKGEAEGGFSPPANMHDDVAQTAGPFSPFYFLLTPP
jgi:hypothetical protein